MLWEYHIRTVSVHTDEQRAAADRLLNEFGSEGWELVTAHIHDAAATLTFFFKRARIKKAVAPERTIETPRKPTRAIVSVKKARR
jgi:hypothetical protein